jgi:hypothetical protein
MSGETQGREMVGLRKDCTLLMAASAQDNSRMHPGLWGNEAGKGWMAIR